MDFPRITVVTPSFNQGRFLEETMRSVLDQGYPNLEYIVVDGASSDNSVEIIRRYEHRLAWWVSEKDKGQSHAINKGFAKATGQLFAYINSDDTLHEGSLAAAAEAFAQGHEWISGWVMFLEPDGGQWPQLPHKTEVNTDLFICNPICQQATFWAARFTRQLGPFWEDMHYAFDYEFWHRLWFLAKARPHVLHRRMGGFRLHDSSKTISQWEAFVPDFERVRRHYRKYLSPGEREAVDEHYRQLEWRDLRHKAWSALKKGQVSEARRHARAALRLNGGCLEAWKLYFCSLRGH